MRVMITGGGTGGHTSPAVAIIQELQRRDPQFAVQWVGGRGKIEERVARRLNIPFRAVPVASWPRSSRLRQALAAATLITGGLRAWLYLFRFRPDIVIAVGGYISVPLTWVAQRRGVPTVLHEQNKRLGLANRLLAARATRLLLSYPETVGDYPAERARVVGNPVRAGFVSPPDKAQARKQWELEPDVPVVLVAGGSQGAQTINAALANALPEFAKGSIQFIWMTGTEGFGAARATAAVANVRVEARSFIDDMPSACAAADLIVGRAGASSTAEIAVMSKPSILIPYPFATDNHQEQNARAFEAAGAAMVLLDQECTGESLSQAINNLLGDPVRLAQMGHAARGMANPAAADVIAEEVVGIVFGAPSGADAAGAQTAVAPREQ
ncbi:MAG: undecaprenyldiphospho-muramoylpentapeptide beta-N-acetylglucosaminyltransferase [Candidatus Hydrogenedentales bacterium]